jgi:hypothetical protein
MFRTHKIVILTVFLLGFNQLLHADTGESETKTIITDTRECRGDIFCLDNMRVTCDARKEAVSNVFDRTVIQTEGDLRREDVKVNVILRKNGKLSEINPVEIKKIECLLSVSSTDRTWIYRDTLSEKMKDLSDCRSLVERNNETGKRILFQEIQEGKNLLLRKFCRVYTLELIKK